MGVGPPSNGRAYQRPWGGMGGGTHTPLEGPWHGVGMALAGRWKAQPDSSPIWRSTSTRNGARAGPGHATPACAHMNSK